MGDPTAPEQHQRIPALRRVEMTPIESDGESLAVLRDRFGIAPEPLVVRASILPFLQLFDGQHTILDLQALLTRATGQIVPGADVEEFVRQFDAALLLDSATFHTERDRILTEFREQESRQPIHADQAYPADPDQLRAMLDGYKKAHADATGTSGSPGRAEVAGLVAPHIDYERGARCYARTYRCLEGTGGVGGSRASADRVVIPGADAGGGEPDLYVLLGTSHVGLESLFSLLDKSFTTPLGELPVDREVADDLVRELGLLSEMNLLAHRAEHSLEVTATYLAYALGGRPVPILPILCGVSFPELAEGGDAARRAIDQCLEALLESIRRHDRRVCFIAGADLAHVGPQFGDPEPVSDAFLAEVEAADRRALAAAITGDAEGFAGAILDAGDRYRVCGLGAIHALLRLLALGGGARGELIDYDQAVGAERQQCVTFAGLLYRREPT